ncbi:MAG TPA: outer membrane beta-barrel protein [Thermodesulfobacteriota bacterium]|nr:outer membrane beta-barrel protein [Thermodesulfobacteriota bacterium]
MGEGRMKKRLIGLSLAVLIILTFGMNAHAEEASSSTSDKETQEVKPSEAPAPPPGLLMSLLGKAGLAQPLDKAGINIYGYIEGGYFHDFRVPGTGHGPTFIGFNSYKDAVTLDKISLNVERTVDPAKKQFDFGFHVEGIYGTDAAFVHSNGLFDSQTGRYQGDLLQAYVDLTLPDLPVRIRAGKWLALEGFEQFSANIYGAFGDPARALYSYSYQYLYAEPFTQTGILVTTVLSPQWSFDAGFTRGWNQSVKDANGVLDFLGRITFTPSDKTSIVLVMTEGPEFPAGFGHNLPKGDPHHWWTALDLVVTQKITDKLSLGLGGDYVYASQIPGLTGGSKQWGGVAGYASYAFGPHFTFNTRLEWYRDAANGFSDGAPVRANYYEATVGVAIKPFPNDKFLSKWLFRPEVRYDRADHSVFDGGDRNQITFSVDALFTF